MHNDFTLFSRVVPSGKMVVYYYAYDQEGKRLGPWTTGQVNKTAARNYCNLLNRKGKLLQGLKDIPTFDEFAADFWDWNNSPYLKDRKKRRELTQHYADKNKRVVVNALLPYFGKMKLDTITGEVIDKWLDYMIKKGYLNSTTNSYFITLQTMMKWAVKKGLVARDPFLDVQKLINNRKETKIITHEEFRALFVDDWEKVWDNDLLRCTAHKLAALTGMRCSEVLGLRGEYVFNDHIYLCGQFDEYGYRDTKTKVKHNIPLAAEMIQDLRNLIKINGQGYIFSLDGGATPLCRQHLYRGLRRAFNHIGISDKEITERGLSIHAWLLDVAIATSMLQYGTAKRGIVYSEGASGYRT
jgi:integrase